MSNLGTTEAVLHVLRFTCTENDTVRFGVFRPVRKDANIFSIEAIMADEDPENLGSMVSIHLLSQPRSFACLNYDRPDNFPSDVSYVKDDKVCTLNYRHLMPGEIDAFRKGRKDYAIKTGAYDSKQTLGNRPD